MKFGANISVLTDIQKVARTVHSVDAVNRLTKMTNEETLNEFERLMGLSDAQLRQCAIDPAMSSNPPHQSHPLQVRFVNPPARP